MYGAYLLLCFHIGPRTQVGRCDCGVGRRVWPSCALAGLGVVLGVLGAVGGLGVVLGVGFGRAGRAGWVGRGVGRAGRAAGLGVVLGVLGALAALGVLLGVGFGCAWRAGWLVVWWFARWLGWAWCWAPGLAALGRSSWVGRGVGRGVWLCWARWLGWVWFQSIEVYCGNTKFSKYKSILSKYKNTLSNYTKYIYTKQSAKVYSRSTNVYFPSTKVYSRSAQVYFHSTKVYSGSTEVYSGSTKVYFQSTQVYSRSTKVYFQGTKVDFQIAQSILTSSARTSRGRKFPKGKELYSTERIYL